MRSKTLQWQTRLLGIFAWKYFGAYFCGVGGMQVYLRHMLILVNMASSGTLRGFRLSVPRSGSIDAWSFWKEPIGKISQDCIALSPA